MLAACLELIHNLLVIVKRCYLQSENIVKYYAIYIMLPTYFKNNYTLKATLLGMNLLPDDGFM